MARRQRPFNMDIQYDTIVAPASSGDATLAIFAPTTGAQIIDAVFYVHTAVGAHTNGTIAALVEEAGTTKALSTSSGAMVAETAAKASPGLSVGNDAGATLAGVQLQVQFTIASTVATAGSWGVVVTWLT